MPSHPSLRALLSVVVAMSAISAPASVAASPQASASPVTAASVAPPTAPTTPATDRRARRVTIKGVSAKPYQVAPGLFTKVPIRVVQGKRKAVAGAKIRVYLNDYLGTDEGFAQELVTTARTNKTGRTTMEIHAPFRTFGFAYYGVDVLSSSGKQIASRSFKVVVDSELPAADPNARCTGSFAKAPSVSPSTASFRAVFVVPCDVPGADQSAALQRNLSSVNGWFAGQTIDGVEPRWVRDVAGRIDVVTVRVPLTRYEFGRTDVYEKLLKSLKSLLPAQAGVGQVVFFDGHSQNDESCGESRGSESAPQLVIPQRSCGLYPEQFGGGGQTYIVEHELTHAFGAVPDCAPHSDDTGHVNDDPNDVLYSGDEDGDDLILDPGHDDYYLTDIPGCPDIADSPFWTAPAAS